MKWEPNEIELDVGSSKDQFLFISDTFYPGWHAKIGETPVEVMRANYIFRAVAAPAGEYRLRMWFSPASAVIGLWISLSALAVTCLILLLCRLKNSMR